MKIVHISFWESAGGAAKAANRLHEGMLEAGLESKMLVIEKNEKKGDPNVKVFVRRCTKFMLWLFSRVSSICLRKFRPFVGNFSISMYGLDISKDPNLLNANVIYLHWINNSFVSNSSIGKILNLGKPVIWFMHDMFPITGGCHHSLSCLKYQTTCGKCTLLGSHRSRDISFIQLSNKLEKFGKYSNLYYMGPSTWLVDCARKSALASPDNVLYVPNFVDKRIFFPDYSKKGKASFNALPYEKIILFGADMGISNPYKGWTYLKEALLKCTIPFKLVIFGCNSANPDELGDLNGRVTFVGKISSESKLRELYSIADLFVVSSIAESFSQTSIEALACGTPVVAFGVGGLLDIVQHKKNGYLCRPSDSTDLLAGIEYILTAEDEHQLALNAIKTVNECFEREVVVDKHLKILNELVNDHF